MKTYKFIQFFMILIIISLSSCRWCDCPDSYLFEKDDMPYYAVRDFDSYDIDNLTFLSENGDTIIFRKDYSVKDELSRGLIKHVTCKEDNTATVDIYYDRTWNRVFFVSDNNDSLGFQYYTVLPSLGSFSYQKYDNIRGKAPSIEPPVAYRNLMFKFEGMQYSLTRLMLQNEPNVFFKYLNQDYKVLDVSFSDVFYREHPLLPINVYFKDRVGLVGIEDLNGKKYIRLL